jgi:uncharacterized protein YdeI (YjbR/CyaY-like superfamily)
MPTLDPRIDAYIEKSAPFARPILQHIRAVVHAACPDVVETMKWSMPHFEYHGVLCNMAAFKAHCAMGFWKGALLFGDANEKDAMGHMGRITSVEDLPSKKELTAIVKKAAKLNEEGVKVEKPKRAPKQELETPDELVQALKENRKARETFEQFSPSHRREYVEWIAEAKSDATRARRIEQAIEWMNEGKSRNWKYERK